MLWLNHHPKWSIITDVLAGLLLFLPASFGLCFICAPFSLLKEKNKRLDELIINSSQYPRAHFSRFRELMKIQINKANHQNVN